MITYTTRSLFLFSVLLCYTPPAFAISGKEWLKLSNDSQDFYVAGVTDAWENAVELCKKTQKNCGFVEAMYQPLMSCILGHTHGENTAIIRKYMKEYPKDWHYDNDMASIIWTAFSKVCKTS